MALSFKPGPGLGRSCVRYLAGPAAASALRATAGDFAGSSCGWAGRPPEIAVDLPAPLERLRTPLANGTPIRLCDQSSRSGGDGAFLAASRSHATASATRGDPAGAGLGIGFLIAITPMAAQLIGGCWLVAVSVRQRSAGILLPNWTRASRSSGSACVADSRKRSRPAELSPDLQAREPHWRRHGGRHLPGFMRILACPVSSGIKHLTRTRGPHTTGRR